MNRNDTFYFGFCLPDNNQAARDVKLTGMEVQDIDTTGNAVALHIPVNPGNFL